MINVDETTIKRDADGQIVDYLTCPQCGSDKCWELQEITVNEIKFQSCSTCSAKLKKLLEVFV